MVQDTISRNVQAIFPKDIGSEFVNTIERLSQRTTDFIRGNPLISTAALGIGTTGLVAVAATVIRKRRKRKTTVRRRKSVRSTKRRRTKKTAAQIRRTRLRNLAKARRARRTGKRKSHRSPRHRGHKRVAFTTKTGQRVSFLVGKRKHKRRKR